MSDQLVGYFPSGSSVPAGSSGVTIFGGSASIHQSLNDVNDATGVHVGTITATGDHSFVTTHHPGVEFFDGRVRYIYLQYSHRFVSTAGWIYPRTLVGRVGASGVRHELPLSSAAPGAGGTGISVTVTPSSASAADGTLWANCTHFEVEWSYAAAGSWTSTNYPYLTGYTFYVDYLATPHVTSIAPTGTVTTSRPAFSWSVTSGTQSAFRLVVVPAGSTDTNGFTVGDGAFDPTTASGLLTDSGKTYSASRAYTLTESLANGNLYTYVKAWSGSGSGETESPWAFATMTVSVATVDSPTVALSNDTASNTLKVQIDPGAHTASTVSAAIQVQYLNATNVWVDAPIPSGLVSGSSTSVFYDGLQTPGSTVSYRARGVAVGADTFLIVSPWVVATLAIANPHQHWLRSTVDYTLNRSLSDDNALLLKSWQPKRTRPAAVSYGVGARLATVVHDVTKADTHGLAVWAKTETAYDSLRALLESDDDLIFVSEWGETWRCQPVGDVSEDVIRAAPRSSESTPLGHVRVVSFSLVEVVAP